MATLARPQATPFLRHVTANAYLYCLLTAGLFTLTLVLVSIGTTTIYIQAYPQDFFLELDGIYRLSIGQKIYTDFFTPFGIALYAVPSLFMHSASDLVLSVNYASGLYLVVGFLIVSYLTLTRLTPALGLALAIWIASALAARMITGGSPNIITLAGNYNRNPEAALALALLLCRTSRTATPMIALADGLLYAFLTGFMFYTKITYGIVALTFAPVVVFPHRHCLVMFYGFVVAFGLVVLAVEYRYGTRFQWIPAIQMMLSSGNSSDLSPLIQVLTMNSGELLVCVLVPTWFLWRERRLTPWAMIFIVMIAGASTLLARSNGSFAFSFLPAILLFVVAPTAALRFEDRPGATEIPRQEWRRPVLMAVTMTVVTLQSGPEFANVCISTFRSLTEPPMVAGHDVLGRIVIRARHDEDTSGLKNSAIVDGKGTLLDAFAIGRAFRPMTWGDNLTMSEYRDYLADGMRAARADCKAEDRIFTLDLGNPFPLLLGWPEGGGMIVIHPDRFLSAKAHLSPEKMFQNIDCVLVPKLPVFMAARDFMLDTYGSYLSQQFRTVRETPLWKVLR